MDDALSINHNWMNAFNIHWALQRVRATLDDVRAGLGDDDGTDADLCEGLLERRCGMALGGLCELLEGVITRRRRPRSCAKGDGATKRRRMSPRSADGSTTDDAADAVAAHGCARACAVLADALDLMEATYEAPLDASMEQSIQRQRALLAEVQADAGKE